MLRPISTGTTRDFMANDTLIREVDEELRRDRVRKLWRQTGPYVIGGAVLVVLVVAGYEGWNWWQKTQSAKSSDQFYAASVVADGKDAAAAKKALDDLIAQGSGAYPMLAQFREAALLAQNGKTDDAVAAYDALSTSIANTHLRELALVLAADLLIDKGDVAAVEQRVGGLMTPASPMRDSAREAMALTQYNAGKLDDAMANFQAILDDPQSSRDMQGAVQIYLAQLQAEGAKVKAPAPGDASASGASSAASAAVDASTELDVTPPSAVAAPVVVAPAEPVPSIASEALSSAASEAASSAASEAPSSAASEAPSSAASEAASSAVPAASSSAP